MAIKKNVSIILFWAFSLYPPVELTRYIIAYNKWIVGNAYYFREPLQSAPVFELWFIWVGYILMMALFSFVLWTKWEDSNGRGDSA